MPQRPQLRQRVLRAHAVASNQLRDNGTQSPTDVSLLLYRALDSDASTPALVARRYALAVARLCSARIRRADGSFYKTGASYDDNQRLPERHTMGGRTSSGGVTTTRPTGVASERSTSTERRRDAIIGIAVGPPQDSREQVGGWAQVPARDAATLNGRWAARSSSSLRSTRRRPHISAIADAVLAHTPTGAKNEALTYSRTGVRFCDSVADGTAGAAGSILPANRPCVTRGGLLVEGTRTNTCLRSAELCNASWVDVGTPACASDVAAGPFGTTTMDSITDDSGAAFEGRAQTIATTSLTQHTISAYVKSSTATSASITLAGTGNSAGDCTGTVTGLSATTSKRVTCTSSTAFTAGLTAVL